MVEERYGQAAKTFDQVESQHPYSVWATKSQLMAAYALYEAENYNEAIIAADRFIQLHPGNRDVDYAYYLKAISLLRSDRRCRSRPEDHRTRAKGARGRGPPLSRHQIRSRRQAEARLHPRPSGRQGNGDRPLLSGREQYLAAMNRFKRVIDNYQTTTHVPEALERLVECDLALGLTNEAKTQRRSARLQLSGQRVVWRRLCPAEGKPGARRANAKLARPDYRQLVLIAGPAPSR